MKTTNVRLEDEVYDRIIALSEGTKTSLNTTIVLCLKGTFELIDADPNTPPPLPLIVELGRVARQRERIQVQYVESTKEIEARVKGWEADRDKIFKAAKAGKASPEMLDVLRTLDTTMKESRRVLDQLRDLNKIN